MDKTINLSKNFDQIFLRDIKNVVNPKNERLSNKI